MSAHDLMEGLTFYVDAEEFVADAGSVQQVASGNPLTTSICCPSVQCG
ncbi:hypothetical protein GCM10012275_13870 [Longimycelium tulufanense]|uniref:Uncharacterized protein n=1 Tax=Longimycelium tulufanense TaxID=907463 RepID=A0A8J3CBD4_9PSEU|nr:hypothetical protein [Longimycelium tulufanense]GGM44064.1 hypothetical protein GCM10012275_13870 [Longimycelium tulufanense]